MDHLARLNVLRGLYGFGFTHNPGGGQLCPKDCELPDPYCPRDCTLTCQIGMQDGHKDYGKFVAHLRENDAERLDDLLAVLAEWPQTDSPVLLADVLAAVETGE